MATPIEILNRKRSTIKSSFTKMKNYVGSLTINTAKLDEIRIRLKCVEQIFKEFVEVEEKIFALNKEDQSQHDTIEEVYYELLARLSEWERQLTITVGAIDATLNDTITGSRNVAPDVKLPGLRVPKFNGDYTEWQTFYQLFTTTIHNSTNLHPVQKYQFLVNSLGEEPARLIRHMDITEVNYMMALNKLKERYDRKRHIVNKFIQMFLNQPAISNSTSKNLRKMYDVSDEVMRALQGLGNEANGRDVWLLYILITKLDDVTRTLWMQHSVENDFPSLESFLKFITNRADALEYQSKAEEKPRNSNTANTKPHMKVLTTIIHSCPICKTSEHPIYKCPKFREMTIEERREIIRRENRCFNCFGSKHTFKECRSYRRCQHCQRRHHTLVHEMSRNLTSNTAPQHYVSNHTTNIGATGNDTPPNNANLSNSTEVLTTRLTNASPVTISVLPTALVQISDRVGGWQVCRVLLDSGAETSFISEECVQKLGLARSEARITIRGLGHQNVGQSKGFTQLKLKPYFVSEFQTTIKAYITRHITTTKSPATMDVSILKMIKDERIADPSPPNVSRIDVLIGVEHFWELLSEGQLRIDNKVIAQNSKLGWIIAGNFTTTQVLSVMSLNYEKNVEETLLKFWESEEIDKENQLINGHPCEEHFVRSHSRHENGRFIVRLPFKEDQETLGNSYEVARSRLMSMERKFRNYPQFHELYRSFIKEYKELNHMTITPRPENDFNIYLPHHCIIKESSSTTRLRVVFDASAQTSSGVALNNVLEVGPALQNSLYHILIKFRKHRIAVTADIEKMYRQILVHPADRKYQCILWRDTEQEPIQVYELNTVTYGMSPSSFLATRVLQEIADAKDTEHPEAANAIRCDMYMDDLMSGEKSVEDALRISREIDKLLQDAGMNLRKWKSNSQQFLREMDKRGDNNQMPIDLNRTETTQVLGLQWAPDYDTFTYRIQLDEKPSSTKRKILAEFSRIFDPLGLIAPFIIRIKIMFQQLWSLKLTWDEPLPPRIQQIWLDIRQDIPNLKNVHIKRWIGSKDETATIHGFSDASERAYAAAVYLCTETGGITQAQLITAKTKVAPTNTVSIARLELCGALLLSRLMKQIGDILEVPTDNMTAWTDSSIVLDWLSDTPQRWKTYVANRTSKILNILPRDHWYHVPSELNPADCATRGLSSSQLKHFHLWWKGPNYLVLSKDQWPKFDSKSFEKPIEERKCIVIVPDHQDNVIEFIYNLQEKFSGFTKFIMVLLYIYRFVDIFAKRRTRDNIMLRHEEVSETTARVHKAIQSKHFKMEIQKLQECQRVPRGSKLATLDPFIDDSGMIRVGGRIGNAPINYDQSHPIVLPKHDPIARKFIIEQHVRNFHCGPSYLLHLLRKRYWIIGLRSTVRNICRNCIQCIKQNPQTTNQKMGMLTKERVELVKPFARAGVDFAGPIKTVLVHGRGQRKRKSYICLFVCMCTKALHIEVSSDLTTESFLAAFDRFVGRRGPCTDVFSDNGSNFRGAKRVIDELNKFMIEKGDQIASQVIKKHQTNWHFIPAQAPHFGGLWEAGVKSIKTHLQRVTGEKILSNQELHTLLVQIEAMLNKRPLCTNGSEIEDVLTPAHYLVGTQWVSLVYPDVTKVSYNRLSHWQAIQKMMQVIWRRWYSQYIHSLQQRFKWKNDEANLQIDQIVLIKDENPLINNWRMGRVVKLHPGTDGRVRLVTLKTATGEIQRVIHKLCPLPTQ